MIAYNTLLGDVGYTEVALKTLLWLKSSILAVMLTYPFAAHPGDHGNDFLTMPSVTGASSEERITIRVANSNVSYRGKQRIAGDETIKRTADISHAWSPFLPENG